MLFLLFPNKDALRCLEANNGLTFGLFLPVGANSGTAVVLVVDAALGSGVEPVTIGCSLLTGISLSVVSTRDSSVVLIDGSELEMLARFFSGTAAVVVALLAFTMRLLSPGTLVDSAAEPGLGNLLFFRNCVRGF